MILVDTAGDAHDGATGVLIPVGRAQTGEGGNHIAAVGILDLAGIVLGVGSGLDDLQLIPQPLNGGTGYEYGAFQSVFHLAVEAPGDGGDQAVLREDGLFAGVHQQEGTGAVGVLGFTGMVASLAEKGRLLVTSSTGDLDGSAQQGGIGLAVNTAGGHGGGQHATRNIQFLQDVLIPLQGVDVEEHGPGGVGVVGDVDLAAGELPDQPGFNGTEEQLAPLCPLPGAGNVFQQPMDLGAGEVSVNDQAGLGPEGIGQPLGFQGVAVRTGTAALPHDGMVNGLAGDLIPNNGGLTLVGDTDGRNICRGGTDLLHGLHSYAQLRGPDLICIVFYPAGFRKVLGELPLGDAAHFASFVEKNTAVRSGTGVQGHDVLCHKYVLLIFLSIIIYTLRCYPQY